MSVLSLVACPICGSRNSVVRQSTAVSDHEIIWYECQTCSSVLLWASDDQWLYQKVGRDEKAHLLKRTLRTAELEAMANVTSAKPTPTPEPADQDEPVWGARLNTEWRQKAKDYPSWARPDQRKKWQGRGLLLWDHQLEQVTRLSGTQALHLLDFFRSDDTWRQGEIVVGEPVTRIVIDKKQEHERKEVLLNQMPLSPDRSLELFRLLERHEADLQKMSEAEEAEISRALARAYGRLLRLAAEHEADKFGPPDNGH